MFDKIKFYLANQARNWRDEIGEWELPGGFYSFVVPRIGEAVKLWSGPNWELFKVKAIVYDSEDRVIDIMVERLYPKRDVHEL